MNLEFLYLDGSTSWHQALENLRQALRAEGVALRVSLIRVVGAQHARALRFRSCPTIRLGGKSLFPERSNKTGLSCRLYPGAEGLKGWTQQVQIPAIRELCMQDHRILGMNSPSKSVRAPN